MDTYVTMTKASSTAIPSRIKGRAPCRGVRNQPSAEQIPAVVMRDMLSVATQATCPHDHCWLFLEECNPDASNDRVPDSFTF